MRPGTHVDGNISGGARSEALGSGAQQPGAERRDSKWGWSGSLLTLPDSLTCRTTRSPSGHLGSGSPTPICLGCPELIWRAKEMNQHRHLSFRRRHFPGQVATCKGPLWQGGNWPQAAGLASSWAPGALLGRGFRSLPQPHVNRWQNKFLIKRKKVSGSARLFMIFRSLWCSFFPFVFLEPESAYCHPALGLGSLG